MPRIIAAIGTVAGLGLALLTFGERIARFLALVNVPHDLQQVLQAMAQIPGIIALGAFVVGVFCAGYLLWESWDKLRQSVKIVEPWYIILIGLVIAAAGLVWQWSKPTGDSSVKTLQSQIEELKRELALRAAASPAVPHTPAAAPPKKKYFAYDIEARLRAIDHLDGILARLFPLALKAHNDFLNNINRHISDGWAPDELLKFANEAKAIIDDLNGAVDGYQSRFPDIARTISLYPQFHIAMSVYSTSITLRQEILQWSGRDQMLQHIEGSRAMLEWRQSLGTLPNYLSHTRNELALKRREYESAEVYGAEEK